jgi:N-sulfoglucosamine sulfohydrolase
MHTKKYYTMRAVLILSIVWIMSCQPNKTGGQKTNATPNIVIFIADDAAWDDSGAYGNPFIRTPNIDRLAKEGMIFNSAFLTTSSCSPSRCSIMTGLYPHNTGAAELHLPLPQDKLIFPGKLQKAGYYTVSAGKWHLGPRRDEFDSIYMANDPSGAADWVKAVQNRPKGKPFFMWLASLDPHRGYQSGIIPNPHQLNEVVVPPYLPDNDSTRKDLALYYDEISRLDHYIGLVVEELVNQGVYDNTVVIFMSDNGRPFPRDKTRLYDSGIKTPFIVRWPTVIRAGSASNALISAIDIAPTVCELAGADVPEVFQGKSFVSLFSRPDIELNEYVFAEHNWHDYQAHERSVRNHNYLFIQNAFPALNANPPADAVRSITYQEMIRLFDLGQLGEAYMDCFIAPRNGEELYDVVNDPYQMNNLIGEGAYKEVANKMRNILEEWKITTNDKLPDEITPDMYDRRNGTALPGIKVRTPGSFLSN